MFAFRRTLAFVRSRVAPWTLAAVAASSLALAQDSFMSHYTGTLNGSSVINRGDFNNDGIPDFITGNNNGTGGNGITVYLGIGDGRFQSPINSAPNMGVFTMAVADFNNDGKLDAALGGYISSTDFQIQIYLGTGTGSFTKGQTIDLGSSTSVRGLTAGDFNADGKVDLAFVGNQVQIYQGAGNGTFTLAKSITVSSATPLELLVGDFNGDGKPDLEVSDYQNLYVLWNTGSFNFTTTKIASNTYGITAIPADVNQDGYTDLLATYSTCSAQSSCSSFEVFYGSSAKTFKKSASMAVGSGFANAVAAAAADINGDGINDIAVTTQSGLLIFLGNPDGSYQSAPIEVRSPNLPAIVASDFNRDGKIDFAAPSQGQNTAYAGAEIFLNATPRAACTPGTVSPSVTVCQPQDSTYTKSPVDFIADATDTANVTAMQIYLDNKLVFQTSSNTLNEPVAMSSGSHYAVTKAWDSSGKSFISPRHITAYTGNPGETCAAGDLSINVCLPTQNQTTTTSVHVFANANTSPAMATSIQVYIDGSLIYNDNTGASYVDTAFTVKTGSHSIVVKAWDADGNAYSETRNITAQ